MSEILEQLVEDWNTMQDVLAYLEQGSHLLSISLSELHDRQTELSDFIKRLRESEAKSRGEA